ncbi:hypothetical protein IEQ34_001554 [Dendrobium chrysotoxum]|uniref:C3H1-type domain-containing protein n=1 Tax=Dendrobium chrysotoxum TaxID=161865 RepID=A0AAV7HLK8_DENCH|nr:hypothetical protein IEQ34_001554 [Dendrobium chrysotoxum]
MVFSANSGDQFESQKQFMLLEQQRLIESYNDAFWQLHHTICYVDSLRKEHLLLSAENLKLLSLVQEKERSSASPITEILPTSSTIVTGFDGTLQPVNLESDTGEGIPDPTRNILPKCISIRSSGFLAGRHLSSRGRGMSSTRSGHPLRLRLPVASSLQDNGEVEVEAYSQGTTKTELCNKWGEMGLCPYAERCQFAHGLEELRPVIRHPRYKTQLCRMLSSGGGCPYGHRCHFRHATLPAYHDS